MTKHTQDQKEEVQEGQHGHLDARAAHTRRQLLEAARASARLRASPGSEAARSQDFLYDSSDNPLSAAE